MTPLDEPHNASLSKNLGRRYAARRLLATLVLVTGACGPAVQSSSSAPRDSWRSRSAVLTADEIRTVQALTLLDVIERLRPQYLAATGTPGRYRTLYVDGMRFGDIRDLHLLWATEIQEVRLLSSAEAGARFGPGNTEGALMITTARARRRRDRRDR